MKADEFPDADAWYSKDDTGECIRVSVGGDELALTQIANLDIRDAVYLRYMLDGAIKDYERAVGK